MISGFNSTMLPSMSSSILSPPTPIKPSVGSFNVNGVHNWDAGSSNNGSSSSSNIELQSNNSFFENNPFSWGPSDCVKSEKEAQNHILEGDPEDIKWFDYLQTPFLLGTTTVQNQTAQDIYSTETKPETHFTTDGSSTSWLQNQQQQQALQAASVYNKHFERLTAA
uniref:Uncharacterized protein n=2 Tax=Davidia involucrata TaxID=16924 RepID=A0A5B6ZY69_DAVIN